MSSDAKPAPATRPAPAAGGRAGMKKELPEHFKHHTRVVGGQQVVHGGGATAQSRQQQHAVGDALGARQVDFTRSGLQRG